MRKGDEFSLTVRPRWRFIALCVSSTEAAYATKRGVWNQVSMEVLTGRTTSGVNHGTFLHIAHEEGLIRNTSVHAGIRAPVIRRKGDVRNDIRCGFEIVKARDIDRIGTAGIIEKLKARVAGSRVYISVDIDVLDPAFAPGEWGAVSLLA